MSISATNTAVNLQNNAVSLAKALQDALTASTAQQRADAWRDAAVTSANIVSDLAYLAANDPKWGGIVGSVAALAALGIAADRTKAAAESGGINAIKAADVLAVVGGLSDIAGNLLVKPGPPLVAGLTLKGAGLLAGVAQNVVGDQTIGQLMLITTANQAPLVATELFEHAPDGIPLNTLITRQVGNHQIDVYWTRDTKGNYVKNENIPSLSGDDSLAASNFTPYQYDQTGRQVSARGWRYDSEGVLQNMNFLVPARDGKSWVGAVDGVIDSVKLLFGQAEQTSSPLISDLDGDGVETVGLNQGIYFDHDANHFSELSGWVDKDDGLLVWDGNANGQIDSGPVFFGNRIGLLGGRAKTKASMILKTAPACAYPYASTK